MLRVIVMDLYFSLLLVDNKVIIEDLKVFKWFYNLLLVDFSQYQI